MTKEAKIACDPVTSLQALKSDQTYSNIETTDKTWKRDRRPLAKGRSLLTETRDSFVSFASSANLDSVECSLCKRKNHELELNFNLKTVEYF